MMVSLPSGTVTFLFIDNEPLPKGNPVNRGGSLGRDEAQPSLVKHDEVIHQAIEANGGYLYKRIGDAFQAAFSTAPDAVQAAFEAMHQVASTEHRVPSDVTSVLGTRMALHTGVAEPHEGDYASPLLNRVARLLSAGHAGQVLLTLATQGLARDAMPPGVAFKDLGEHRLRDLARPERVFQLAAPGLPADFPPLSTLETRPNNLPLQPTPLVGREREIAECVALLRRQDVALLTITGVGGIGKTRVALQVAAELLEDFADGVYFINLAPVTDPSVLIPTIAQALGVREAAGMNEAEAGQTLAATLGAYLAEKQMLLMLDNLEQLLESPQTAPSISALLKGAPQVKVLVTSRSALRLYGEREYPLAPLSLPNPRALPSIDALSQYEAVALFIARAQAARPDFQVTNFNAPAIAEICVRLDGLPLAIELAAARTKILSPDDILARLGGRLKLLTGGARDLPARQQTLRGAIEWSYGLLDEGEKQLFRRMSVFIGGRTLEAAERVCNASGDLEIDVLDGMASLVDKSLMYQREAAGGDLRLWMLETIHEYAREKLDESGETAAMRRHHAEFFLDLSEKAEHELKAGDQVAWLELLEEEHDNIRAMLEWALEPMPGAEAISRQTAVGDRQILPSAVCRLTLDLQRVEVALSAAAALYRFWETRGHLTEGRTWLERALARADEQGAARDALYAKGLNVAGNLALNQGDYAGAQRFHEGALSIRRDLGVEDDIATSLSNLGNVAWARRNFAEARLLQQASLDMRKKQGDKWGQSYVLNNLALVAYGDGHYDEAYTLLQESLELRRQLNDKMGVADAFVNLADVAYDLGNYAEAFSLQRQSLAIRRDLGDKVGAAMSLEGLGGTAARQPDAELGDNAASKRAARLLGAAEAIRESVGARRFPDDLPRYESYIAGARDGLDDASWQTAWDEGRAMTMEQAIAYALEEDS